MKKVDFPACCTMKILRDFGESPVAEGGSHAVDPYELERNIEFEIQRASNMACLVATTNSEQEVANKVLLKLGFEHSPWMSKLTHRDTKVRLWWYRIIKETGK